jgi:hypothetical protein
MVNSNQKTNDKLTHFYDASQKVSCMIDPDLAKRFALGKTLIVNNAAKSLERRAALQALILENMKSCLKYFTLNVSVTFLKLNHQV